MSRRRSKVKKEEYKINRGVAKVAETYQKSNYRIVGKYKHSAVKPCHWTEQRMLTGRNNRNCYKGYFGIESHLCVQNSPVIPFCNHRCVFCWRDIENGSAGSKWRGPVDDPALLAEEMIKHSVSVIQNNFSEARSLQNLKNMKMIINEFVGDKKNSEVNTYYIVEKYGISKTQATRALVLMKDTKVLYKKPKKEPYVTKDGVTKLGEVFYVRPKILANEPMETYEDGKAVIHKYITTSEDIKRGFREALKPKHAAISLAGEPTLFPKIGELVVEFRKRRMSSFIVTNGTHPDVIRKMRRDGNLPTQLYVTLAAPNEEIYEKTCRPLMRGGWKLLMETLELLAELAKNDETRTVIRITSVAHLNVGLEYVDEYVAIFKKYTPHFIDIKGLTLEAGGKLIAERLGTDKENKYYQPEWKDMVKFAEAIEEHGFEILNKVKPSTNILLRGCWPKDKKIDIDWRYV